MKKITLAFVAIMLTFGMTQCKKESQNDNDTNEGELVYISLKMSDAGAKHVVHPETGAVDYSNGDVIYVGNNGHYVGTLTCSNGIFNGAITSPSTNDYLHFFFVGGCAPSETLSAGSTTSFSVNIADQTSRLPVISYSPSTIKYSEGITDYSCMLMNKCALVKFNVTTLSSAATCITGFNNQVMVDFSNNTLTPSKEGEGVIKLAAGNGERWAILLPHESMPAGQEGSAYSENGDYSGTCSAVPTIINNDYLTTGIDVIVTTFVVPTGAICGKFTVNRDGGLVYFSQGNLQYQATTDTWKFADNQYDYIGSNNTKASSTYNGWIDLFCWGTSGYHDSHDAFNMNYFPWSMAITGSANYNTYGFGPSSDMTDSDLIGTSANYDWGVYNPISNGGNQTNQWRTLAEVEWHYVFNVRNTPSGIRYAKACVNSVNGVILLPDDWSNGIYSLGNCNTSSVAFSSNTITADQWPALEAAGAVFLPAAGYRYQNGSSTSATTTNYSSGYGDYWSTTAYSISSAKVVEFTSSKLSVETTKARNYGLSVRLVRDGQ